MNLSALEFSLDFLDFPDELRSPVREACLEILADPAMLENYREIDRLFSQKEPLPALAHPLTGLLVALQQFPAALAWHRERGISEKVTRETFSDLLRLAKGYREDHGEWGFGSLWWMRWHFSGELFQLGLLQFQFSAFALPFVIFQEKEGLIAFAEEGLSKTADGRLKGRRLDLSTGGLEAVATEGPECGAVPFLKQGDPTLAIHIARGQRLDPAACEASLEEARRFFPKFFPRFQPRAFRCLSWLLDPALEAVMKADSNIVQFGRRFHRMIPPETNGEQIIERTFGKGVDPLTAKPQNPLQVRIAEHLRSGGIFQTTAGIIPF